MAERREFERLQSEIEGLISDLWQVPRFARGARHEHRPQVDCYRSADPPQLTVVVELPGIDPGDVEITATPGMLVVEGRRAPPEGAGRVHQLEIEYGPFHRRVPLPDDVDVDAASASYARGMLTIALPVAQQPRRPARVAIEIEARP